MAKKKQMKNGCCVNPSLSPQPNIASSFRSECFIPCGSLVWQFLDLKNGIVSVTAATYHKIIKFHKKIQKSQKIIKKS